MGREPLVPYDRDLTALSQRSQDLETQIALLVPSTPARFVDSVPGIGPLLAARYLAAIGDPSYFATASQIWALAGYDLITAESGDTKQIDHITKRGSPALRDTLYHLYSALLEKGLNCGRIGASIFC